MDGKQKERKILRRFFTQKANQIDALIKAGDKENLISEFKNLQEFSENLLQLDKNIKMKMLLKEDLKEEDLEKEMLSATEYRQKFVSIESKYNSLVKKDIQKQVRNFKLPEVKFKKFDGNIRNWLSYWGQFKKIDDDKDVDDDDKYFYLIQSIEPNTDVYSLVESYPSNGSSYQQCIEELKQRYGRQELLIEVYVRELLALVLDKKHDLTELYDKLNSHLRSLETLGVSKYTAFILPLVESALPIETLKFWERRKLDSLDDKSGADEVLPKLMSFLKTEVNGIQRIEMAQKTFTKVNTADEPSTSCFVATTLTNKKCVSCVWCDKTSHASAECYKLNKLSLDDRKELLKKKKACTICLKTGHHARFCKTYIKCYICGKRHSVAMCPGIHDVTKVKEREQVPSKPQTTTTTNFSSQGGQTLLQTLIVNVTYENQVVPVRALYDNGSQKSYVCENLMQRMGIKSIGIQNLCHSLFGNVQTSQKLYNVYKLQIESINREFSTEIEVLSQPSICGYIPKVNLNNNDLYKLLNTYNITLTDAYNDSLEVELLIGADFAGLLMTSTIINLGNGLVAIKTKLGWTLHGKEINSTSSDNVITMLCCSQIDLADYWSLEMLGIRDPAEITTKCQREADIISSFESTVRAQPDGRYEVQLPFKVGQEDLLSNYKKASKRLDTVTKRLLSTGNFHEYHAVFEEWLTLGIIEPVPQSIQNHDTGHYLPHKAVIKTSSLTTKIRPVFDASALDDNGLSLNMCLEKGVNYIDHIPNLLIRFRKGVIGMTADIAKAFLQISLYPEDRNYLKFLWWEDISLKRVIQYRHCRVVFGLTSSPYLLMATILHHLNGITGTYEETAKLLKDTWYVDNCVTSVETEDEARKFIHESKCIMAAAKFDLRMWVSSPLQINEYGKIIVPVLGLNWNTVTDELFCNLTSLPPLPGICKITKRLVLSLTQRIFDPIGLTCAVTLVAKLILKQAWHLKLKWDEALPHDLAKEFTNWYTNINYLKQCKILRRLTAEVIYTCKLSLHMFCDASKNAIATCIFLRAENNEKVTTRLIAAKSRVAPPKSISIPRLELLALVVGSRLLNETRKSLQINDCDEYYWTDSSVALYWICKDLTWNVFVGNRVKEIKRNTAKGHWRHIPGTLNWADLPSRGCDAKQFVESQWLEGPPFLSEDLNKWPKSPFTSITDEDEAKKELRKSIKLVCNVLIDTNIMTKLQYFSKYTKIVRTIAWIFRFRDNCLKNKFKKKNKGDINNVEFENAEKVLIRIIQEINKDFLAERTKNLYTFYDTDNLLRIRTKLTLANVEQNFKYPILVPAKNKVVELMLKQKHEQLLHAGVDILIAEVRKTFWVIGIRRLAKSTVSHCHKCKIYRVKNYQAPAAPLPIERVDSEGPFYHSGVDLAGPLYLKSGEKAWIVLFTCAVYRAVHLELTLSLSTEAFINTFRRFIARRGRVSVMYSDNGTNFVGTKNLLNSINWEQVETETCMEKIKWKLNAPTGAWWGGFFERMIRTMKELLRRVLGRASVTYDELQTLLCECEAIMNNRPLTYVQDDKAESLEPLTPSCFLLPAKSSATGESILKV